MSNRQIAIPIEVEQKIDADDSVRLLEEIIDKITSEIKYQGTTGRDTSHITLLKIIIYGYMEQITSLRGIEKSCRRENMRYEPKTDTYYCAEGRPLAYAFDKIRKSKSGFKSHIRVYECECCGNCTCKELCTKSKYNKRLYVSDNFLKYREESLSNITGAQGILFRVNRSIQVEGAFGVLKEDYGFRRLNRRGHANVKNEFTLHCIAYNINKYCNKKKQNKCGTHFYLPRAG
jgi:transposase